MKNLLLTTLLVLSAAMTSVSAQEVAPEQINSWVLEAVNEMPTKGGYVLTNQSPQRLRDAFSWNLDELLINERAAVPSYCTTATYVIFYKVLQKYWAYSRTIPSRAMLEVLKPNMELDGVRMWGRWNSNGPATAKLFHETGLGVNFEKIEDAQPGDFLKLFWNGEIGKNEKGHVVIYLGTSVVNGTRMIRFWGSNKDTSGYGIRNIPMSDAKYVLFSRLMYPERAEALATLPEKDDFLASMLNTEYSWSDVKEVSGL